MPIRALLPILALLASLLRAQVPDAKPGSLEGIVLNSVTSEPVKKAVVTLLGGPATKNITRASTDAAGHFRFEDLTPGSYTVSAGGDGFVQSFRGKGVLRPVTVADGQQVQGVSIKLLPLATVTGHVVDDDGDPVIRANVTALRYQYVQGRRQLTTVGAGNTDDRGQFEIANLSPGRYYFSATARSMPLNLPPRTRWTHPEEVFPVTYYPSALDAIQATPTDVSAGARLNIDFRLKKAPAYHVRGKVAGVSGRNAGNLQLANSIGFGFPIDGVTVQEDGSFDKGGNVNGSYTLTYWRPDGDVMSSVRQKVTVAGQDVNDILLTPSAGLDISGTVSMEGTASSQQLTVQVSLEPVEPTGFYRGLGSGVENSGVITIHGVSPEVYRVNVFNTPPGKYVKSIRFGDRDAKNGQIDLTSGVAAPLNIVLGADGGSVSGTVENADGQPAMSAFVTVVPEGEEAGREDLLKQATSDPNGKFEVRDIAPGKYRVFAWEEVSDGAVQSAEFRAPFESKSVSVMIGPSGSESIKLTLISSDDIDKERSKLP